MSFASYMETAVLDIGSARAKMVVASVDTNGQVQFHLSKIDTGLADAMADDGRIDAAAQQKLVAVVSDLRDKAIANGAKTIITVATDVFRRADNASEVTEILRPIVGFIHVLTPSLEGLLLYRGMRTLLDDLTNLCVVDVGGGSVQIAWGDDGASVASLPTGTFRLEKNHQRSNPPTADDYDRMAAEISSEFVSRTPKELHCETLVFGSNYMEDFVSAALDNSSRQKSEFNESLRTLQIEALQGIFDEIRGRPYQDLARYFPENPGFMWGADKALLNILEIARHVGAVRVVPTNESVSTSIIRLNRSNPDGLASIGIHAHRLY